MMSAAMLMLADVKQTSVSPASADLSADLGKPEEISFAKSFNDRVGESASSQGKSSAQGAAIVMPDLKVAGSAKKLDAVAAMPDVMRGKTAAVEEISKHGTLKSVVAYKAVAFQTAAVTGSREKTAGGNSVAKNVASQDEGSETADDNVSPRSSISYAMPGAGLTEESVASAVSIVDKGQFPVLGADSPSVQKETGDVGKTRESVPAKKTAKTQENLPISKSVQKAVGTYESASSKPAEGVLKEDAVPALQGIVVTGVSVPRNEGNATGGGLDETVPAKAVSSVAAGGLILRETGHGTKAAVVDTETAATSPDGQLVAAEFGADLEKAVAVTPASNGGEAQSAFGSVMGPTLVMGHSVSGNVEVSGAMPIAIVPVHSPGEPTATKLPIDAGTHAAGLTVGSKEQDQAGIVTASPNEMPRMLTATPTALEVGIQNGTHGWLKVRAEMADGGVVNASISAASSTGQEMLHRELPALGAYLQQEKVAVNTIVVHAPLAAGVEPRSSTGMDSAGGGAPPGGHDGGERQQSVRKAILDGSGEATTYQSLRGVDEDGSLSLATYASGGSWLSVRA
jgi:hypothetical protein